MPLDAATSRLAIDAMAFYHPDGLQPAWTQAETFAGAGGRLGTLPDVLDARLATEDGYGTAWNMYFTTVSAEYVGLSRGGNKLLLVAHGIGPMATMNGAVDAYRNEFTDRVNRRNRGRIGHEDFLRLLDGQWGEVAVVDLQAYLSSKEYPFMSALSPAEALEDPVARARFGSRLEAYVARHAEMAADYQRTEVDEHRRAPDGTSPILCMSDDSNAGYAYWKPEEGFARATLLSVGQLAQSSRGGGTSLCCEVHTHEWNDGTRFLGLTAKAIARPVPIHRGFNMHQALRDPVKRTKATVPTLTGPSVGHSFCPLVKVGDEYYTQYPKVGATMDTGEPEHRVVSMEPVGDVVEFSFPVTGYHAFVRYDLKQVQALAPEGADSYVMLSVDCTPDAERHVGKLRFFRTEVDVTRRLLREKEVFRDFAKLVELAA
jgi:hypothetical protein